jgi:hypothetical protein
MKLMSKQASSVLDGRLDVSSLEADMAFFEARLSLAGDTPDTSYQLAQIKTYQTLGLLVGDTLKTLKPKPGSAGSDKTKSRATA